MPKTSVGTAHRHRDSRGKWVTEELPHTHDFTETRHPSDALTDGEVIRLKTLLAASGGSGGGTTPVPNTPPPADPPTTEPSGSGVTLPVGTSQTDFLTAVANLSYDYILLAGGDRSWNMCDISVDRTANPLLIQPVAGQRVRFTGAGSATYGVFRFGVTGYAKYITFDGRVADGFVFDGITIQQAGVLAIFGSDHLTWRNYTARNLKRGGTSDQPYKSWFGYVSAPYGGRVNTNLILDRGTLQAPTVNRDVSAYQVASSGSHSGIDITNQSIDGYYYAFWADTPVSDLQLDEWAVNDCGSGSWAIRVETASASGSYSNITATASDGLRNLSPGAFTDGGGNSGL